MNTFDKRSRKILGSQKSGRLCCDYQGNPCGYQSGIAASAEGEDPMALLPAIWGAFFNSQLSLLTPSGICNVTLV
jgi:hypothetical protein